MESEERPSKLRKLDSDAPKDDICVAGKEDVQITIEEPTYRQISDQDEPARIDRNDIEDPPANGVGANYSSKVHSPKSGPGSRAENREDGPPAPVVVLSKNQLKKLRNKEIWEAGREDRKMKRKQKILEKKARKRTAKEEAKSLANCQSNDDPGSDEQASTQPTASEVRANALDPTITRRPRRNTLLAVTLILDCGFDKLMTENERISLGSQLTRCYSDNHRASFQAHLVVSSWGGELKKRFDTILSKQHEKWKGVRFMEEDFAEAAAQAMQLMKEPRGGDVVGVFATAGARENGDAGDSNPEAEGEVVYLTSDSPYTLERLKPYSTYIIGGLVDKNRHKGICYKTACEKNIKTAKLPIGEYMEMQSRFVLATNHVSEIMVRWLECGNWGEAFLKVMPKRKGGRLKTDRAAAEEGRGRGSEEQGNSSEDDRDDGENGDSREGDPGDASLEGNDLPCDVEDASKLAE